MNRAVFLDRDGVINDNKKPVNKPKDLLIFPWVASAIKSLNNAGFKVFVVTNQGGIELGYFKKEDLESIHRVMIDKLSTEGAVIDDIIFCPHFKTKCECRKPASGMLLELAEKYNINLSKSYMIGDRDVDIISGKKAGCIT